MQHSNALYKVGHLHVLFSALQHGVEKTVGMKRWIKRVNMLERFLSDRSLRRLFAMTCLRDALDRNKFHYFSHISIDWQWECLVTGLDQLLPLLELMIEFYAVQKI